MPRTPKGPKGPEDWDPRDRLEVLEELAREMVGDGKSPNLFFVSMGGNITMVTREFEPAYALWRKYARLRDVEAALEDRRNGTISSLEPIDDSPGARLIVSDDSLSFGFREREV